MDELLELLKAVPNSYEDFVECVSQLAEANQDKIDSLIRLYQIERPGKSRRYFEMGHRQWISSGR